MTLPVDGGLANTPSLLSLNPSHNDGLWRNPGALGEGVWLRGDLGHLAHHSLGLLLLLQNEKI